MANFVVEVTDVTFEEKVLNAPKVVLVDFGADWCAPCKQLIPIIEDIAETYKSDAVICKIDMDKSPEISAKFNIRALPTMLVFVNGEEKERLSGLASKTRIASIIDKYLEC